MSAAGSWDDPAPPSYRPIFQAALVLILSLTVSLGSWAVYARLDGAVITRASSWPKAAARPSRTSRAASLSGFWWRRETGSPPVSP